MSGSEQGPNREQLDAMRFLDGEMHDVERTRFAQKLEQDPALQDLLAELQMDREWFTPERQQSEPAPDGLVAAVLTRLDEPEAAPRAEESGPELALVGHGATVDTLAGALHWSRQLLIAALVLLGLAAALFMGRLAGREAERLEAAPDRIRVEMEKLDEQIRTQQLDSPGAAGRER